MSAQRRWVIPLPIVALCILITSVIVIQSNDSPKEPKSVFAMPEGRYDDSPSLKTGGISPQTSTVPNARFLTQAGGAEIAPLETAAGAGAADDIEPLEARFDDESVLGAQGDYTLSPEEREKRLQIVRDYFDGVDRGFESIDGNREASFGRADELEESDLDAEDNSAPPTGELETPLKFVDDFFDELDHEFASIDADREALTERVDELEENYFAYIDALAALLSPKYQRRFDEIESHDELTQEEVDGINDELQVIGKELGIEIDDYMQSAAEEFFERFTSLNAAIDKLYERDEQLIKEMEEFTHDN